MEAFQLNFSLRVQIKIAILNINSFVYNLRKYFQHSNTFMIRSAKTEKLNLRVVLWLANWVSWQFIL